MGNRDFFVQIFLRGAMDGLTTVYPHGDPDYAPNRPTLAVPPPGSLAGAVDLDGFFGLPPAAADLAVPFNAGHLAIVHACGSPDPTRSHFDAFKRMEFGVPNQPFGTLGSGWLARHLSVTPPADPTAPLRAVAWEDFLPRTLSQAPAAVPVADPSFVAFPGDPASAAARKALLRSVYAARPAPVGTSTVEALDAIDVLNAIDFAGYVPSGGAVYPTDDFARKLKNTAALIKADVGVEVAAIDLGGWDLHANFGNPVFGEMVLQLQTLSRALLAFYLDIQAHLDHVTVAVVSEFGRRLAENASLGLDHGHGNALMLLGGNVAGGVVHGTWPGLAPGALDQGDLAITTDYRDVLGEVLVERMQNPDLTAVFPNHVASFPGVVN